jgi:hypothetical protein
MLRRTGRDRHSIFGLIAPSDRSVPFSQLRPHDRNPSRIKGREGQPITAGLWLLTHRARPSLCSSASLNAVPCHRRGPNSSYSSGGAYRSNDARTYVPSSVRARPSRQRSISTGNAGLLDPRCRAADGMA